MNQLFYGDNLDVLRKSIRDETIDLIYLDPPFNSKREYNIFFRSPAGASTAQIEAFDDTWSWSDVAEFHFAEILKQSNAQVAEQIRAFRSFLHESDLMAYLTEMTIRLLELHRVLKSTGSLYLHCDPAASHYLKILLDGVFIDGGFRSEIIWRRSGSHNSARRYGPIHDTILFYTKSKKFTWNREFRPYLKQYVAEYFTRSDSRGHYRSQTLTGSGTRQGESGKKWRQYDVTAKGRHWAFPGVLAAELDIEGLKLHEKLDYLADNDLLAATSVDGLPEYRQYMQLSRGLPYQDVWAYQPYTRGLLYESDEAIDQDVKWIGDRNDPERLGYPTQKPLGLLYRIIKSSSNEGELVLDPFCGCGTAVHAAQKLKRKWIGIDITHLAISLIEKRLMDAFKSRAVFEVHGTPKDLDSARDLAARDKYQFQWWAVSLVNAQPFQGKKKGADTGIDGVKYFYDLDKKARKIVVSVKGGAIHPDDVRALNHVRTREKAEIALFVSLEKPTPSMVKDAASAGIYTSINGRIKVPRVQLLTIEQLLAETKRAEHPDYEPNLDFKKAQAETAAEQTKLL